MSKKEIKDWSKWSEESHTIYRYVVASKCAYYIIIRKWYTSTNILTAKADLYICGLWADKEGSNWEMEILKEGLPVQELLDIAYNDYAENCDNGHIEN